MADNTLHIDLRVDEGGFTRVMNDATEPVNKLNTAVKNLSTTLDKLDAKVNSVSALKKVAKDLGNIVKLINAQESLGRGNLENLSRTAGVIKKFVEMLGDVSQAISEGKLNNLSSFTDIMKQIGGAFTALDKIKKPANLVAVESGVRGLKDIISVLTEDIPSAGNMVTRWLKVTFRLKPFIGRIASALNAFDKIQKPANLQAVTSAIIGLRKVLDVLADSFNLNVFSMLGRFIKMKQFSGVANAVANALKSFDKIKSTTNLEHVTTAINSLSRIITTLSSVAKQGQSLARLKILGGGLTQAGTLLSGFNTFAKRLSKSLGLFAKFNKSQIRSLETASLMINSLTKFMRLFQVSSSVLLKGGDVIADFSQKDIDFNRFKTYIDMVIQIAQYISKAKFDANKVEAFGTLQAAISKFGTAGITGALGAGKGGVFSSLQASAASVINTVVNLFRKGAQLISSVFRGLFVSNPFKQLISWATQSLSQVSQTLRNFGREMTQLGTHLLATGGVAGFIQSRQVGMVMDFESIMKQIEVLGGVVGDELQKAETLILSLGESSIFTASEVAAAFLDLSKAGLSVNDISASLGGMLDLAAAGGISVEAASNLVINAVKAMGLSFSDTTMIADMFVAAANISIATVEQLANAFGYAANTAAVFGQELPQVTAALALMMDKGIPDERAGTSLDAFMRAMIKPSGPALEAITSISQALMEMEKQSGALTKLGVSFEGDLAGLLTDAEGNYRDLNEIIKLITIATEDWTEAERANALSVMAGSANAGRAILALTGQYEDGTFVIDEYLEKQQESASAAEVGAALMDTARGALEEMTGAFETLLIKALTPVIEYGITPFIRGVTEIIRLVSKVPQPILAGVAAFIGLSTVLITITGSLLILGGIITQIMGFALTPLISVLWALLNPLKALMVILTFQGMFLTFAAGLLFLAPLILTIVGAIQAFRSGLESLQGTPVLEAFSSAFERLKTAVSGVLSALGNFLNIVWQLTSPSGNAENTGLVAFIISQITDLMNTVSDAIEPLTEMFNMLSSFGAISIPGFTSITGPTLPSAEEVLERSGLTREAFAEAFGAPLEELGEGIFDRDAAKNWLALNSMTYQDDLNKLDDMIQSAGGIMGEGSVSDFIYIDSQATNTVKKTTKQLRTMDDVLRLLDEDSYAFKTLAANLEPFADNPIIEMLMGKDVTGADLARTLTQVLITVDNLRNVGSRTLRTFAQFFDDLRNGVGTVQSFKNLIKGLLVDAGMLAAVFLDVTTSLLGIQGLDTLIANLASGNLEGALVELGKLIIDTLIDSAKTALNLAVDVIVWSWDQLIKFESTIDWGKTWNDLVAGLTEIATVSINWSWAQVIKFEKDINWGVVWNDVVSGLTSIVDVTIGIITWSWDKMINFVNDIDWQLVWDKVQPTLDDFLVDGIIIPFADLFKIELPTRQVEGDSIIPVEIVDRDSLLADVKAFTDQLAVIISNLSAAVSGPGVDLIKETVINISDALKALTEIDPKMLVILGIELLFFTPILSTLISVLVIPLATVAGALALINGLAKAIPDLVEGLNKLAEGDASGALDSFGSSLKEFWIGTRDTVMEIMDFVATLFGGEDLVSEEKFQAGLDAWSKFLTDLYYLFLEKFAIPLGDKIESLLSFGDLKIAGQVVVPGQDFTVPGLQDAKDALAAHKLEIGITPTAPTDADVTTAATTTFDKVSNALLVVAAERGGLVPISSLFDTTTLKSDLSAITGGPEVTKTVVTMLTGKPDGAPVGGSDVFDVSGIQADSASAQTAVNQFSTSSVTDIGAVRSQIQGLATDFSNLATWAWLIEVSPVSTGAAADMIGPVDQRAEGGPVFKGRLYEVVEKGLSELLEIGGRTFLIPGENGRVIPPSDFSRGGLIRNDEYRPREGNIYNTSGESFVDNSRFALTISGSELSAEEMRQVAYDAIDHYQQQRTRSIPRRLRAKGRS